MRVRCLLVTLSLVACRGGEPAAPGPAAAERTAQVPGPASAAGAISGTVVDRAGRPVAGAVVALVPIGLFDPSGSRFARVASGVDGSFRFSAGGGPYGVTATRGAAAGLGEAGVGVTLQLDPRGKTLSGRVIDRGGRARAGAEVRLVRGLGEAGDVFLVDSAANGRWSAVVPDGEYHAHAVERGGASAQVAVGGDPVDLVIEPVGSPAPHAVVDWLRERSAPLATVEPGRPLDDLAPVRAMVGDARVVGLGEVTHGTREIFQIKHRVLEFLVAELGFTVFAIELGLAESFAIDAYVLGGPGEPEMLLAGQLVSLWQTEELRDLLSWMREWNRTHARKVRFHGVDVRTGVRAARGLRGYLRRVDRAALASPAGRALAPIADPIAYQDVVRRPKPELAALAGEMRGLAERFEGWRSAYVARSSEQAWWRAAAEARALAQMLEWRASTDTAERVRVRESAMAENTIRALERYGAGARAVWWAHNAHVSGNAAAAPRMAGVHLRARLGDGYRAFGTLLGRGAYQAVDPTMTLRTSTVAPSAAPGSLEQALAAGHPLAIVSLRAMPEGAAAEWLRALQPIHQYDGLYDDHRPTGWASPRSIVTREYDALLFVAKGTVARSIAATVEPPAPLATPSNLDLEEDDKEPRGWRWVESRASVCGYEVTIDRRRPLAGRASARIARTRGPRYGDCAGELSQIVDGARYRGKRVRVSAQIRVARRGEHVHLTLRSGPRRAAAQADGREIHVELDVPADATTLEVGFAFDGDGAAAIDSVSLVASEPAGAR